MNLVISGWRRGDEHSFERSVWGFPDAYFTGGHGVFLGGALGYEALFIIRRGRCGYCEGRIFVILAHLGGFVSPILQFVMCRWDAVCLNDAEGVDPEIAKSKLLCYSDSLFDGLWQVGDLDCALSLR